MNRERERGIGEQNELGKWAGNEGHLFFFLPESRVVLGLP